MELSRDVLPQLIADLPNNMGLFLEKDVDNMLFTKVSPDDLVNLGKDDLFHVVGIWNRPWVGYYTNWLEYEHFPPETPLNDEFQFRIFKWHDILWAIVSVPMGKKQLCYDAAEISHLKLADGVPIAVGEGSLKVVAALRKEHVPENSFEIFPLSNDHVFTLEQKRGDVVYEPGGVQDSRASEEFQIRKLWEKHGQEDDPWKDKCDDE